MNADEKMKALDPQPIEIIIFGQPIQVKKMSVRKQFEAGEVFQQKKEGISETASVCENMLKIISLVTGISIEDLDEKSDLNEIRVAFELIWKQNGFDRFTKQPAEKSTEA